MNSKKIFLDISQEQGVARWTTFQAKASFTNKLFYFSKIISFQQISLYPTSRGAYNTSLYQYWVPQGSVLGPILCLLYTLDLPILQIRDVTLGTFADDTVALSADKYPVVASSKLQTYISCISEWLLNWRIKANEAKSVQVTFTTKHSSCAELTLNDVSFAQAEHAKYLGIHLDRRLSWRTHIFTKREALGLTQRTMH